MASMENLMQDRFDAHDDAVRQAQADVIRWAHALVMEPGGLRNNGEHLIVVEKADKSDPHYQLCKAFEHLASLFRPTQQDAGSGEVGK